MIRKRGGSSMINMLLASDNDVAEGGKYVAIIVAVILFFVMLWVIFRIVKDRKWRQCSQCKKRGALREIDRKEIKTWTEYKTVKEKKPIFDKNGKDTGKYIETERESPEDHVLYEVKMKCKHCGNVQTKELEVRKLTIGKK